MPASASPVASIHTRSPPTAATSAPTRIRPMAAAKARTPYAGRPPIASSDRRLIGAEDVLHGAAHLAHRAAIAQGGLDRRQQAAGAARDLAQLLQPALDEIVVAVGLERLQARHLLALGLGVDAQQVGHLDVLFVDVAVDAHHDVLAGAVALLVAPSGLVDLA